MRGDMPHFAESADKRADLCALLNGSAELPQPAPRTPK
jgi:hypothetical protein